DGCCHTDTIITSQTHQPTTGQHVELSIRCSRPLYSYHNNTPPAPATTQTQAAPIPAGNTFSTETSPHQRHDDCPKTQQCTKIQPTTRHHNQPPPTTHSMVSTTSHNTQSQAKTTTTNLQQCFVRCSTHAPHNTSQHTVSQHQSSCGTFNILR